MFISNSEFASFIRIRTGFFSVNAMEHQCNYLYLLFALQTVGGNIVTGSPISDLNPVLMACQATLNLASVGECAECVMMVMRQLSLLLWTDQKITLVPPVSYYQPIINAWCVILCRSLLLCQKRIVTWFKTHEICKSHIYYVFN